MKKFLITYEYKVDDTRIITNKILSIKLRSPYATWPRDIVITWFISYLKKKVNTEDLIILTLQEL